MVSDLSAVASAKADASKPAAGRFSIVYAVNTIGAVSGSLAAGFIFIPRFGLQPTLTVVSGCLIAAALAVIAWGALSRNARVAGTLAAAAAVTMLVFSPPWDRELLASGAYMYAPYVPKDVDLPCSASGWSTKWKAEPGWPSTATSPAREWRSCTRRMRDAHKTALGPFIMWPWRSRTQTISCA